VLLVFDHIVFSDHGLERFNERVSSYELSKNQTKKEYLQTVIENGKKRDVEDNKFHINYHNYHFIFGDRGDEVILITVLPKNCIKNMKSPDQQELKKHSHAIKNPNRSELIDRH
jgi:hypothetical protein